MSTLAAYDIRSFSVWSSLSVSAFFPSAQDTDDYFNYHNNCLHRIKDGNLVPFK